MTSIGTAVRRITVPMPYAVAATSVASVSPMEAAGAEDAIPMTTSCVTLMASGSSLRSGSAAGVMVALRRAGTEGSGIADVRSFQELSVFAGTATNRMIDHRYAACLTRNVIRLA
jgi:hypothetical protein